MVTASIKYTSDHLLEALDRYHRQGFAKHFFFAVKVLGVALFAPQAVLFFGQGLVTSGLFSAAMVVFFLFLHQVVRWFARWSFRSRPYYEQNLLVEFSEDGFYGRSETIEVRLPWSAFTKVARFADGFLLFQGPRSFNWIPISSLDHPSQAAELEALLRSKITGHKVAGRLAWPTCNEQ